MIAEPFLAAAKKVDRVLGSPYDAISKDFLVSAYFTNAAWAKDHADLLKRFIAAMYETAAWANRDHAKSADLLVEYSKIGPVDGERDDPRSLRRASQRGHATADRGRQREIRRLRNVPGATVDLRAAALVAHLDVLAVFVENKRAYEIRRAARC